jgi:cytochrome c
MTSHDARQLGSGTESAMRARRTMPAWSRAGLAMLALAVAVMAGCDRGEAQRRAADMTGGDPAQGPQALRRYGCQSCHVIPGVAGARGLVGPPLDRMGSRTYVAGQLTNTPENLMHWIRFPRDVNPRTAMPETGVTEEDARHIAAYLYTLR